MENSKKWVGWIAIVLILVITATALGITALTPSPISNSNALSQYESVLKTLAPGAADWQQEEQEDGGLLFRADDGSWAVQQIVQGYAGPVEVVTAVKPDGVIAGVHVGGSEFRETEGLGAKAREPAFTSQFAGKTLPVTLGENIEAIAGATVTSRAVVDAVNLTLQRMPQPSGTPAQTGGQNARTANASVLGYGGPVLVRLTLDEEGRIAALDVGGARFAETEGVGSRVREESFTSRFVGLTPPVALNEDVDALAGATVSSQAVVDAVNEAHDFLVQNTAASDTK